MASKIRVASIQMLVKMSKSENIIRAEQLVREAVNNGAKLVSLPEYFTCVLDVENIVNNREPLSGKTTRKMSEWAKEHNIFLVGGTIPITYEKNINKVWNMCCIFNPDGEIIGKHCKMHMFDADLGEKYNIVESESTAPGNSFTTFETGVCKVGVGVCMDNKYPEVARVYTQRGCELLIFLGASSAYHVGPAQWEVVQRTRAIDNQVFVMTVSPARDTTHPYVVHGYSAITNPWGEIMASAKEDEEIIYADLDMTMIDRVRKRLPLEHNRRNDLYKLVDLTEEPLD